MLIFIRFIHEILKNYPSIYRVEKFARIVFRVVAGSFDRDGGRVCGFGYISPALNNHKTYTHYKYG
jgi:hypothetical protein